MSKSESLLVIAVCAALLLHTYILGHQKLEIQILKARITQLETAATK